MPAADQGAGLNRYMLIPRTLTFLTRGDNVLLLKGSQTKRLWAGLYNGVGGHVEPGEDIQSAARRELTEETGLSAIELSLCGIVTVNTQANPGVGIFIFRGECLEGEPTPSQEGDLVWVNRSRIAALPLVEDLYVLLPKILSFIPGNQPFFARSWYNETGKMVVAI